jgi:chromosome segregation ATPase
MKILTERDASAMQVAQLTVQAMRTATVMVVDSGKVAKLQARIAELEQVVDETTSRERDSSGKVKKLQARISELEQTIDETTSRERECSDKAQKMQARIAELEQTIAGMTARETERVRRRTLLQDNTLSAGHPEFCDGPPVPILSLRGWFKNRQPVKPGLLRRWYLRLVFRPLKG